jgi:hypothetical protein
MNQAEIAKLVTCIEENLRASPTSGLPFVDSRHSRTRLLSKQNHVVFGRRGAGKTTLVSSLQESGSHIEIYLNLEDYKDITFPNIVIHILIEMLTILNKKINSEKPWYKSPLKSIHCKKEIRSICSVLSTYLHEPDQETQEVDTNELSENELSGKLKTHGASSSAKTKHQIAMHVKRNLPKSKIDYLKLELSKYKKLIISISSLLSGKPIFLIFDDLYFVTKVVQPDLIDYFHRLTKGTSLFLKVATIRHRSKLYRRDNWQYVGVEPTHDIFEVDMDYTLDNFDELQHFMRALLDNAIQQSKASVLVDEIFSGDGFSQLSLASGGVPRDFLSLFVTLANNAAKTDKPIGKIQVTDTAISNISSKLESMKKDSGSEDAIIEYYLSRIKRIVYDEKRTNAFLISKEDLENDLQIKQAIRELVDLRLIHLVDHNTSKAPSDGRRYEAYILDIGLYDNPRPRSFTQIEPGQRDDRARKDALRASPVIDVKSLKEPCLPIQKSPTVRKEPKKKTIPQSIPEQLEISFEPNPKKK